MTSGGEITKYFEC